MRVNSCRGYHVVWGDCFSGGQVVGALILRGRCVMGGRVQRTGPVGVGCCWNPSIQSPVVCVCGGG